MPLIKSVVAANRQSPTIPRKFVAWYHRNTKLWILPVKRDKVTKMPPIKSVGAANRQSPTIPRKFVALYHRKTKLRMRSDERKAEKNFPCFILSVLSVTTLNICHIGDGGKACPQPPFDLPPLPSWSIKYLILKTIV